MVAEDGNQAPDSLEAMLSTARSVVRTCLQIRREEDVLIITDPETSEIGQALYEEASRVTDRILLVMMPPTQKPGKEPPLPVSDIMRKQRVILIATKDSLSHTRARLQASREGARIVSMPGISKELFEGGGMTADYNALQREISGMGSAFRRRRKVRVTSSSGTDVEFQTGGRWVLEDNGICNRPGQVSNLPAGKVFVLPKEGTMSGTIVIDGAWEGNMLEEPVTFIVEEGDVVEVSGGKLAEEIISIFELAKAGLRGSKKELVWTVAEFGIGLNPKATRIVGNRLEDQVVRGSAYFGFGDNTHLSGSARVGFHLRGVMKEPSVSLEEAVLLEGGRVSIR
jgi:leucyl aminopeptidase (aminopeptidase T)